MISVNYRVTSMISINFCGIPHFEKPVFPSEAARVRVKSCLGMKIIFLTSLNHFSS